MEYGINGWKQKDTTNWDLPDLEAQHTKNPVQEQEQQLFVLLPTYIDKNFGRCIFIISSV